MPKLVVSSLLAGAVGATLLVAAAAPAGERGSEPTISAKRCKAGYKHGLVGGKHACLRVRQRCKRRLDRQYHRYGFHCHGARLARRSRPSPSPPPPPPAPRPIAGQLAPGTYETQVFRPRVRFTVPAGWAGSGEGLDGFELIRRGGDLGLLIGVSRHFADRSVADTVAAVRGVPGVSATAPTAVSVGGAAGQRFTVTVTASSPVTLFEQPGRYAYVLHPGDAARVDVVDVRGTTVVVITEAPSAELASFLVEADRVLETVAFP